MLVFSRYSIEFGFSNQCSVRPFAVQLLCDNYQCMVHRRQFSRWFGGGLGASTGSVLGLIFCSSAMFWEASSCRCSCRISVLRQQPGQSFCVSCLRHDCLLRSGGGEVRISGEEGVLQLCVECGSQAVILSSRIRLEQSNQS